MDFSLKAFDRFLLRLIDKLSSEYGVFSSIFNSFIIALLLSCSFATISRADTPPVILALGDSLTAGYGLERRYAFPTKLEAALQASGVAAKVINGGVSGDTTAGGFARLDWMMADQPNLVIIELGANDGLRALNPDITRFNLVNILKYLKDKHVNILLTGMLAPPNLGVEYETKFNSIYPELSQEFDVAFYPFFLDGVIDNPKLNQGDGIHPNAEGVDVIVKNILPYVRAALEGKQYP